MVSRNNLQSANGVWEIIHLYTIIITCRQWESCFTTSSPCKHTHTHTHTHSVIHLAAKSHLCYQLTIICYSSHPVTVWSLPSLWHTHHPNVVGGASLQCSHDGGCISDFPHLQGPFWWGTHLPWSIGVLDSVGHTSPSKSLPLYSESWRSALHTTSDMDTDHFAGELSSKSGCGCRSWGLCWSLCWPRGCTYHYWMLWR